MKSLLLSSACALVMSSLATARDINVAGDNVKKTEIRHGQIGPRDTVIFYSFADHDAVLQINIMHDGGKFTLKGKMQLFKEGTGAEAIGKWINNQHSDALFGDAPKPEATVALPADACAVTESKIKEGAEAPISPVTGDKFQDYALKIEVSDLKMEGFQLKGFTAETGAFVKLGTAS